MAPFLTQEALQPTNQCTSILQFALPNYERLPSVLCQSLKILNIPLLVSTKFRQPKATICFWNESGFALVRMPETSMNEYHFVPCGKNQIRLTRKILPVQTEPIAELM